MLAYISLNEAIQKMDDLYKADCDTYGASIPECFDNDRAINALKELSTVFMPSTNSFNWCVGCKEYDQENHCCHRWSNVIRNTVEENREYLEQVKWERDLAVKQLEDLGYGLGEKPRVGKWVLKKELVPLPYDSDPLDLDNYDEDTHSEWKEFYHCSNCDWKSGDFKGGSYCRNCGARMEDNKND